MRRITAHWTRLALADAPSARSSHRLSAIDGRGYLFGGEAEARQSLDSTVHCLDATAGTWTRPAAAYGGGAPAAAPQPRVGHAQAAVDGKLLVFGGRTGEEMGEAALDDLWQWDPASALWEPVRLDGPPPPWPPSPWLSRPTGFQQAAALAHASRLLPHMLSTQTGRPAAQTRHPLLARSRPTTPDPTLTLAPSLP